MSTYHPKMVVLSQQKSPRHTSSKLETPKTLSKLKIDQKPLLETYKA